MILKAQQKFLSEKHITLTEEVSKIALSANNDQKTKSIDLIETHAYGTSIDLIWKKGETKCNNMIEQCKKELTLMMLQKKT